ncbi:uncharacterized protein LOC111398069 [Olea europaea var. sylvestris]|uniref:uncharacterized protein LOC111398069 n=1 Tax=Olea europaea var. sylvestris TaxID=158386 RepID=UPI000C1D1675|nr:uncharacterized protein LOC111398069 [Olea europaea var. sylvestris]
MDRSNLIACPYHYLVPLTFIPLFSEEIYCDVLPMDFAHVLLGRPWLYDHDVKYFGHDNIYEFLHNGKTIRLLPAKPSNPPKKATPTPMPKDVIDARLQLLSFKDFEHEGQDTKLMFALAARPGSQTTLNSHSDFLPEVTSLLNEFSDVMPIDLPDALTPMWDI